MPNKGTQALDLNKVLVVDDQPPNRRLIGLILEKNGFTLSFAANGKEGLKKAQAELPFLVLSDIMMPVMNGFELCEALKTDERTKDTAVILITAHYRDVEMLSKGMELGADDYIYRPVKRSELEARVKAVARLKKAEIKARQRAQIIARRNKELEFLNDLALKVTSSRELQKSFTPSMPQLCRLIEAEAAALTLSADERQRLRTCLTRRDGQSVDISHAPLPEGDVATHARSLLSDHLNGSENSFTLPLAPEAYDMHTIPLVSRERALGAITIIHRHEAPLAEESIRLLNSVASIVTVADENIRLLTEVQAFNRQLEQMVEERTQQLVEEKQKTETILSSMADGLLVLDNDNHVLMANDVAEEMLNFHLDDMQGRPIAQNQLDNPLWRRVSEIAASSDATMSVVVNLPVETEPDGVRDIQARSAKLQNEDAASLGTVIVLRDITALKAMERMKARFMAGVTHELKTPLAVIRVHANNLSTYRERLSASKQQEILGTIQKQVTLLEQSVEDILALTRMDVGEMEMEPESVDLRALVDEVIDSARVLAESKQIALHWEKSASPVMIHADPDMVSRAVRNLVDNAIKYTPAGGSVDVQALATDHSTVEIRVEDTGVGIASEHQKRIFDRFYRVDPSHTIPGAGLGLAIVQEIVRSHNGEVNIESTPGEGSTFVITLPGRVVG